jgi:tetratricopeptide (TPR) repeat protein
MIFHSRAALLSFALAGLSAVTPAFSQVQAGAAPSDDRSSAYYNFAMAHLYGELAATYGNRGEYVNKAIDFYRQAMKIDPSAVYVEEELTEFYAQTGQLEKATQEADSILKAHPDDINAHKILGRIYSRQVGDPDSGKFDRAMLQKAIEQYQKITQADPKDNESLSQLARLYRANRDAAGAEKIYRQILALDPNDDDALNGLALVYADRGDLTNAIAMLKQAVEKNPDPRTLVMLAEFYDQNKDFSSAADAWKQVASATNDNVRVRRQLAEDLLKSGRFDEALDAWKELAAADPSNAALQLQIAELLERKRDFSGAEAAIAKAKAVENNTAVHYAEAELLQAEGKIPQAIAALQAVLNDSKKAEYSDQERGERMRLLDRLGQMQQESGKTQEAVSTFRQIADLDPTLASRVEVQVIEALKSAKDFKTARQTSDAALKKFPGDRGIVLEHALLLGDLGQTDAGIAELKALPQSASDREIVLSIAQIQDKAKRFEEERKTLDSADTLAKTPQEKQAIQFMRGAMFEREKNFDAAEKTFRAILDQDPNNAGAMNYLGYMYADRNVRLDEAQQLISKALDLDPDNGAYLDSLGWVHFRLDKLDMAADELRQAVDKVGKDPTVHDHLGEVYFKQGKVREAIQQWEAAVNEWKAAAPSDQDPAELAKVTKKLEGARVRISQKTR